MKTKLLIAGFLIIGGYMNAQVHDLAISRWLLPQTEGALGETETIRFEIENLGSSDETNFTVAFSMNGGQSFTEEVYNGTVPPGSKRTQTFTATGNFSVDGATYNVIGKIILAGDEVPGNDEIEVAIINKITGDMCDEPIVTSFYADAYINDVMQTSGVGTVDFSNAVTQNIYPFGSQDWMISVEEGVPNAVVLAESKGIILSPNPVISEMLVQLPSSSELFNKVTVVNSIGNIVHTQSTGSSRTITLPLGHLPQGIYFVVIEMDGQQEVKKFMKR